MTSTRHALALLRDANPVPTMAPPATAPRAARLLRPRRLGYLALATAGIAALVLQLGLIPLPWSRGTATPAAAAALDQAARATDITAADQAVRPDQFWRIRTVGTSLAMATGDGGDSAWTESVTSVEYVAVDGARPSWHSSSAGTVVEVFSGLPPAARGTESTWTTNLAPNDVPGSWQMPNPAWLAALPRDTAVLRQRLYADTSGHGRSRDGGVLVYVADVLRSGMVPAELRAALYRVLETVPGVDIVRRHDDGRISIGRLEARDGQRQEVIIDPRTGAYLGDRMTQVQALDTVPAGAVVSDTQVTTTVVDGVPKRVRDAAEHWTCTVASDGGVGCGA